MNTGWRKSQHEKSGDFHFLRSTSHQFENAKSLDHKPAKGSVAGYMQLKRLIDAVARSKRDAVSNAQLQARAGTNRNFARKIPGYRRDRHSRPKSSHCIDYSSRFLICETVSGIPHL
jgi:L-aminopeptidase/D-esterase-like protein